MLTLTQFPLSILYLIQKYAGTVAELEFAIVNVEVAEPPEQMPSDCETDGSIYGQSTVVLFKSLPVT